VTDWLDKIEINARYYAAVAGDIAFETEASLGYHPGTVARILLAHAASLDKENVRILEIGASNCLFARALLGELRMLGATEWPELVRLDYLAVDLSRSALERAVLWEEAQGTHRRVLWPGGARPASPVPPGRPEKPELVALVSIDGEEVNVGYVHADANQFVEANTQAFDFVILNELLDDMACRAFYADGAGRPLELVPLARDDGERWTVRIEQRDAPDAPPLPAESVTSRSSEAVALVEGIARSLAPGGMLIVHDYGFAGEANTISDYEAGPPSQPAFVEVEYPREPGFPRGFFRVFGNEGLRAIQITNDVNFAELAAALQTTGDVLTLPHGNQLVTSGAPREQGQGVFLTEFGLLQPGDDLPGVLERLRAGQADARDHYIREHVKGHRSLFLDLVYIKR
jgi:SAM-dependent MidA family methyltransferase